MALISEQVTYTAFMTPAPPHLLGVRPTTSASPSLPPQKQQGYTMEYSATQLAQQVYQMCLSHHQVCRLSKIVGSDILSVINLNVYCSSSCRQ